MEAYTVKEVCDIFKISHDTVYRWIKSGKIRTMHLGRMVRIPKSEIDSMMGITN
jgi:excisionase family DNA binding protein